MIQLCHWITLIFILLLRLCTYIHWLIFLFLKFFSILLLFFDILLLFLGIIFVFALSRQIQKMFEISYIICLQYNIFKQYFYKSFEIHCLVNIFFIALLSLKLAKIQDSSSFGVFQYAKIFGNLQINLRFLFTFKT